MPPRRRGLRRRVVESRQARLRCRTCGRLFTGRVWFEGRQRLWRLSTRGNRCPRCGSLGARAVDPYWD